MSYNCVADASCPVEHRPLLHRGVVWSRLCASGCAMRSRSLSPTPDPTARHGMSRGGARFSTQVCERGCSTASSCWMQQTLRCSRSTKPPCFVGSSCKNGARRFCCCSRVRRCPSSRCAPCAAAASLAELPFSGRPPPPDP